MGGTVSVRGRRATTTGWKSPDDVDTADGIDTSDAVDTNADDEDELARDDDTDTSFTSLEQHMFGERYFENQDDGGEGHDLTTMLHRRPSDADTVLQRGLHAPPPTQVVTVLPPGARPTDTPAPSSESAGSRPRPQGQLIAAGGVFAGMSFVAAASLVAMGLVAAVAIYFLLRSPTPAPLPPIGTAPAPGEIPVPGGPQPPSPAPGEPPRPVAPAVPAELVEGVRFPATFAFNDWQVQNVDQEALAALVSSLVSCPGAIRVTGHTDARGAELVNDRIAIARAGEVRRVLEGEGIDRKRLEVSSAGSGIPAAEEDSPEARAQNRRVTVRCD